MSISIVIPWRPTPSRIDVFNRVTEWYKKEISDVPIITEDAGGDIFNLAASRNKGIKKAFSLGAELVIVSDADVFVEKKALLLACSTSFKDKVISAPYTRFHLTKRDPFMEHNKFEPRWTFYKPTLTEGYVEYLFPCSGVIVVPKEVYNEIGGFDENYVGWGPEDQDYHKTYLNKYGKLYDYIEGDIYSIDHDKHEWAAEELKSKNLKYFNNKFK